jgi:biopolymer transport protein ExbB
VGIARRFTVARDPIMAFRVGTERSRLLRFLFACLLFTSACGVLASVPTRALAQEGEEKKEGEAPAAPPDEGVDRFSHMLESVGPFFGFILASISILLVTLIVILAMDLRLGVAVPPAFVDEFTEIVNKRQFKQAFELCRSDNSFLGRVLTAGMGRLQYGIEDARETANNMVESIKAGKDQLLAYLGTIGTVGPMIGLVGTVFGMIDAFRRIQGAKGAPNAAALAGDISHALWVTLIGIALSVPAIFCYAFFKNRLTRIAMDTTNLADDLLTQMYHNSKKTPTAAGPTAAPAAAPTPTPTAAPAPRAGDQRVRPAE